MSSSSPGDSGSVRSRLRERLKSADPFWLAALGLLGVLGDRVPGLELLQLFHAFWLFLLWPFAAAVVGGLRRWRRGEAPEPGPRDWLAMSDGWRGVAAFLLGVPLSIVNPLLGRQDVMQLLGSGVAAARYGGSLPGPETFAQSARYRLPVDGTWTVVNGSPMREHSHSWFPATQRYAYDLVVTDDEGRTRPADADASVENYYCYDRPVLAPADGVVVDVHDGDPQLGRAGGFSHPFKRTVTGNAVTIRHAPGEYTSLVHLVPGSVEVEPGERVSRGQRVARCGHSGNSSEPHLHVQLQDHPAFEVAAGLPVRFDDVAVETPGVDVAADWDDPDDGAGRSVHVGQRVTHAPDGEPPQRDDAASNEDPTSAGGLGAVRTAARLSNGFAVGGFATAVAGFVVSAATISLGLAAAAGAAFAAFAGKRLFGSGVGLGSVATVAGVAAAAAAVGGVTASDALPAVRTFALGGGVFLLGFAVFVAGWEYARLALLGDPFARRGD
ncbi:peptidase M23 family protein [Halobacterium hubeiense]|uniref:Peptidase M23 family protein n=1 Tax=Halobacterium hubeiense TaxID=1407499 RepID=A0A0U5H382_9EURY|nr:M23 family metallopeptidase [Halobacterium hubeiense]CQH58873.1 peptidase M23 family protein [Halobacterium hubeiense]